MISKNKKETLISKINLSSLKVLWVLVYSASLSGVVLILQSGFQTDYNFLLPQWTQTAQAIITDNTLYLVLQMKERNISAGANDLNALAKTLELDHKGVITDYNLEGFNYNILTFHLPEISDIYNTVYFSDLCGVLALSASNLTQC
jgi:hypothetical protein